MSVLGAVLLATTGRPDHAPVIAALVDLAKAGLTAVVLTLGVRQVSE